MKRKKLLENPYRVFNVLASKGWANKMADEQYLKLLFRGRMGRWPDLEQPQTFSEKLQWLKLHDRRPEYTVMADKYLVRDYIAEKLGPEYLIPLLGAWDDPDEIDFDSLPERFVLKCNHNSGLGMCICKDKAKLDRQKVRSELKKGLMQDYYLTCREWPYREIPRKIICEAYMSDGTGELADYKVHNFNGEPKVILVCRDRFSASGLTEDFFSETWEHLPLRRPAHPNSKDEIPRPELLTQMLECARILAKDIPFARTDFYIIDNQLYFGEITFFPAGGMEPFVPESWDSIFGGYLTLPADKMDGA